MIPFNLLLVQISYILHTAALYRPYASRKKSDPSALLSVHQASQTRRDASFLLCASAAELAGSCDVSLGSCVMKHDLLPPDSMCKTGLSLPNCQYPRISSLSSLLYQPDSCLEACSGSSGCSANAASTAVSWSAAAGL